MFTLKKNTPAIVYVINPTNNPAYSCTQIFKNGGAGVSPDDGACTDNGDGLISVSLDATDTDTVGSLALLIKDGLTVKHVFVVGQVFDQPLGLVVNDGTDSVQLANFLPTIADYGTLTVGGINITTAVATEILNMSAGVESSYTLRDAIRLILAATVNKSDLSGSTRHYRNPLDTKNRITATTDQFGQRLAVTTDPT